MGRRIPVLAAAFVVTLSGAGCWWPNLGLHDQNQNTGTKLYGIYFSPYTAYPDEDLWVQLSYSGRLDATRVRWFINGVQIMNLNNLMRMPAGTAKVGDSVTARARIIYGADSTNEQFASVVIQPIPILSLSAPVVGYLNLKGVSARQAILSGWAPPAAGGAALADTATTDANGKAAFTIDGRIQLPITLTVDGGTAWYGVSRSAQILYGWDSVAGIWGPRLDTVRMIPRLVDANSVDQLDYCRKVTGTDGTSGTNTTLVNWGKPLLQVYLNRAAAPTAGLADSVWQAFAKWNAARGVTLFVETPVDASYNDVLIVYDQRTAPLTALTYTTGYPSRLLKATVHVPLGSQADTAFVRAMVHEAGHAQGLITDFARASYAMSLGGGATAPGSVEAGCSLMFSALPVGHDMSQYR